MTDVLDTLTRCPLLAGLPPEALAQAAKLATVRDFAENQTMYSKGSSPKTLVVIQSGAVRVNTVSRAGKELTLMICGPDNWFGDAVFWPESPRLLGAVAHEDTRIIEFASDSFMALLAAFPQCYPVIIQQLGLRLRAALMVIEDDALRGIPARLARRLLFIAAFQYGRTDHPVSLRLTQEQLGTMLGITRQATQRAMQLLVAKELVELRYGSILLSDPAGLETFIAADE
ncbi:Crp/Fnr family transcriptional regulator [Marinobacter mobilis]|uniref:cAMP-binding domain of CRP or a regulatory subunit of cAMP-dependent protein kinases n=1 Tax=Marinobacter mobilis TaxID=488533 RepID=A0A1H2XXE4_9GAMM|nr:Crp/Fnr family transcriptional regulator [Marinobacter mobilis]SDW97593.1 cAMP-binding domain of CRP or a regulatory subunit of cAMP-dependent protein kinases [Marinobacter mobilis]